ncbi:MAG: hypothetical protein ACJ8F1_10655 [Polyangia bacterium]
MSEQSERVRSRIGHGPWILAALTSVIWMVQGSASWYVVGHACPGGERQWSLGIARAVVLVLTAGALAIAVAAIVRSVRTLRATPALPEGKQHPTLLETMNEQKRFTAWLAMVAGAALTLGLIFAGLSAIVIRVCGETR